MIMNVCNVFLGMLKIFCVYLEFLQRAAWRITARQILKRASVQKGCIFVFYGISELVL